MKLPKRYTNVKPLDGGGMSNVFWGVDSFLDRKVAIKVLKDGVNPKWLKEELNSLIKIRSKHVVQVYEVVSVESGKQAIIQEFVDGSHLDEIPKESLLKILYQLADSIHEIHSHGIVHRDIKPDNFKINGEGVLKVFDFGLSKSLEDAKTKGFKGTFIFAAPELFSDDTLNFDEKIDVYAFGVTCAYFALGEKQFQQRLVKIKAPPFYKLNFSFKDVDAFQEDVELHQILDMSMSLRPESRPTMKDLHDVLKSRLLYGRHRGALVYEDSILVLDRPGKKYKIKKENVGEVLIHYDGFYFYADDPHGEVYINAQLINSKFRLPSSCVITIGSEERMNNYRLFIPFDFANPEVTV